MTLSKPLSIDENGPEPVTQTIIPTSKNFIVDIKLLWLQTGEWIQQRYISSTNHCTSEEALGPAQ